MNYVIAQSYKLHIISIFVSILCSTWEGCGIYLFNLIVPFRWPIKKYYCISSCLPSNKKPHSSLSIKFVVFFLSQSLSSHAIAIESQFVDSTKYTPQAVMHEIHFPLLWHIANSISFCGAWCSSFNETKKRPKYQKVPPAECKVIPACGRRARNEPERRFVTSFGQKRQCADENYVKGALTHTHAPWALGESVSRVCASRWSENMVFMNLTAVCGRGE